MGDPLSLYPSLTPYPREYRKVKVDGHVEQVLQDLKALRRQ
jgi:hypothetical protein